MPTVQTEAIVRYIHSLVGNPAFKNLTDGELLKRFVGAGEEAAFTELLRRHGRLVWGVCRRILHHEQEAEDAFQIVFLVLTNRAKSIRKQASVSSWLYGVAYRVAVRIKQKARKRRACEEQALRASPTNTVSEACFHELQAILDDELNRLPEKYRAPFVLCYFEARSGQEAARELGLRERTLSSRLAQARKMLQKRLRRRGATLTAGLCAMALAQETAATALPPALFEATRAAALLEITGKASAPLAPGIVATVEEILRSMAITKLKVFGAMILATSLVAAGAGMLTARVLCERPERKLLLSTLPVQVTSEPKEPAKEAYTGLDCFGDPLPPGAIARLGSLRLYHGQQISCVTVAPDSQTAVGSVQPGGESRLWSLATGKEQPLPMHLKAAFFFAAGGKLMAVQRQNRGLGIWDVSADKEIVHLAGTFQGPFALSPDGKVLVKWSGQPMARQPRDKLIFTHLNTGTSVRTIELEGRKQVHTFAFSANGKTLGTQYFYGSLDVWDTAGGTLLLSLPSGKGGGLGSMALSPEGTTLAAYRPAEKKVRIWNIPTRKELSPLSLEQGGRESSLSFSPDGKFLATTYDGSVGLWDLKTRKEIRRFQGAERNIQAPSFTPDGQHLCAADGTRISIWNLATGERIHDYGHHYVIDGLAFAPDGKTVVSGAAYCDPVVRCWDTLTGRSLGKWHGHTSGIEVVTFSPKGNVVASGSQDGTVRLWDPLTGKEKRCLEAKDGMVYGMAFGPDGKTIASGGQRKAIHLWDVATGRELHSFDNPGNWVLKVAWSPDGQFLTTRGFGEDIVRVWDMVSGKELRRLHGPGAGCPGLAFSPDSTLLASSADDGTVRLWNIHTGSEVAALGPDPAGRSRSRSFAVAFSPDGRTLAAGYEGGMVRLWELASRQERARFLGHQGGAYRVAFSPDGSLLASGGTDQTGLIWDVTGQRTRFPLLQGPWTESDLEKHWTDLAALDATEAYRALQALHSAEQKAVELLSKRLRPAPMVDSERIPRFVKDLDHDEFTVRERASRVLEKFGDRIAAQLQQALANQPSPELRRRVEALLEQGNLAHNPEKLRALRAVEVLERIGSVNAQQVLGTLSQGASDDRLTKEAKAALRRLAK